MARTSDVYLAIIAHQFLIRSGSNSYWDLVAFSENCCRCIHVGDISQNLRS